MGYSRKPAFLKNRRKIATGLIVDIVTDMSHVILREPQRQKNLGRSSREPQRRDPFGRWGSLRMTFAPLFAALARSHIRHLVWRPAASAVGSLRSPIQRHSPT